MTDVPRVNPNGWGMSYLFPLAYGLVPCPYEFPHLFFLNGYVTAPEKYETAKDEVRLGISENQFVLQKWEFSFFFLAFLAALEMGGRPC